MRPNLRQISFLCLCLCMVAALAGCGDGNSGGQPTTITFDFSQVCCGTPHIATQTGTGAFTAVTFPQNGQLTFAVPSKTTFAVAWSCRFGEAPAGTDYVEYVLEATPQDLTSYSVPLNACNDSISTPLPPGPPPVTWSYSGPTPAALPTFGFDSYTALNGQKISEEATVGWATNIPLNGFPNPVSYQIDIKAMPSFLSGKTAALTIPDLSGVQVSIGSAPSGDNVTWTATISGPSSGVQVSGNYTEP